MTTIAILTTSWDDGAPEDVALGELLAKFRFRATFYATTGPTGHRMISDRGLERLVELGHELGNHGRTHRLFIDISTPELLDEVAWGEGVISCFAEPSRIVAPPRGATSASVIHALNDRGFTVRTAPILGSRRRRGGTITPDAQVYPHTRIRTYGHLLRRRTLPSIPFLKAWSRSKTVNGRLREMMRIVAAGGDSVLHLWGHSEEIRGMGLWRDLEHLLAHAAELGFESATNGEIAAKHAPVIR